MYHLNFVRTIVSYIPIKNHYVKNEYILKKSHLPSLEDLPETFIKNLLYSIKYLRESLGNGKLLFLILILEITLILSLILLVSKEFIQTRNNLSNSIKLLITFF